MPALASFRMSPASHNFILEVAGIDVTKDQFEDALFEAGLSDALILVRGEQLFLDVDRKAATYDKAVASAKDAVKRAGGEVVSVFRADD